MVQRIIGHKIRVGTTVHDEDLFETSVCENPVTMSDNGEFIHFAVSPFRTMTYRTCHVDWYDVEMLTEQE